jgi:hypothetical protein
LLLLLKKLVIAGFKVKVGRIAKLDLLKRAQWASLSKGEDGEGKEGKSNATYIPGASSYWNRTHSNTKLIEI